MSSTAKLTQNVNPDMSRRLFFGLAVSAGTAALLSGCQPATATKSLNTGNITVTLWHPLTGKTAATFQTIIDKFNSTTGKTMGATVKAVYQADGAGAKLQTLWRARDDKNLPDIAAIAGFDIPVVAQMQQLASASDLYKGKDISVPKEDLIPNCARAYEYEGKLIGLPYNASMLQLYCNSAMFTAAGLDPTKLPSTIDELAQVSQQLMGANPSAKFGFNAEIRRYHLSSFIGGQGKYNFFGDKEGGRAAPMTKVTFAEDKSMNAFLTEWEKLVKTGTYKAKEDNINEEFAAGVFGMALMSSGRIQTIAGLTKDKFDFVVGDVPKVALSDTGGAAVGGGCLVAFDNGDERRLAAAWAFNQFAASPEVQYALSSATGYLPVNSKTYDLPEMKTLLQTNPNIAAAASQLQRSHKNVQEPLDIINQDLDAIYDEVLTGFADGKQSSGQATDAMANRANEALTKYHHANG